MDIFLNYTFCSLIYDPITSGNVTPKDNVFIIRSDHSLKTQKYTLALRQ